MSDDESTGYGGTCFCGAVRIRLRGAPFAMGYCHCKDCRAWSASPVSAYSLWTPDALEVIAGADRLSGYAKTEGSQRKFCEVCGGHVYSDHPPGNFIDVYASVLPTLDFEPSMHVNYESAILKIRDGLPKLKGFPAEMGGSGQTVPE